MVNNEYISNTTAMNLHISGTIFNLINFVNFLSKCCKAPSHLEVVIEYDGYRIH